MWAWPDLGRVEPTWAWPDLGRVEPTWAWPDRASPRRLRVVAARERVRVVAALDLGGVVRPHRLPARAALGEDRQADHADVLVAGGLRGVRLGDLAEPERGDVAVGGAEAVDDEVAVRVDDVAAARRVGGLAVDDVEAVDRRDHLEARGGRAGDGDLVARAVLADDQRAAGGGVAGQQLAAGVGDADHQPAVAGGDLERLRRRPQVGGVRGDAG